MNNIYRYINTEKNKNDKIKLVLKGSNSIDDSKSRVVNDSMKISNSNNNHNRINLSRIINNKNGKIGLFSIKKGFINHNNEFLRDFIINNHTSHSKGKNRIKDNFNVSKKNNVMPILPLLNN